MSPQSWLLAFYLVLTSGAIASSEGPRAENFETTIRRINAAHAAAFASGICSGRLVQKYQELGSDEAVTLVDCDFKVVFDRDKFRLERNYRENNLTAEHQRGIWDTREFVRQVLIYRGDENYWARFDAQGNASCLVLNRKWAQTLLKYLDSPGPHPVRLWEAPSWWLQRNDDLSFDLVPLQDQGILARGGGTSFSITCYLLPPQPLRLSRIALQVGGATVGEYNLSWTDMNGTPYVNRYSETSVDRQGARRRTASRVIELDAAAVNIEISPQEFELSSLGVTKGTEFRVNAPVPTRYKFDGEKLLRITQ